MIPVMFNFSPITIKRMKAFKRNRRAWWSLILFIGFFIFSMCADLVCPISPTEVIDAKTLEQFRERRIEETHDVRTARCTIDDSNKIVRWEGPQETKTLLERKIKEASGNLESIAIEGYDISFKPSLSGMGTRVFLQTDTPPKVKTSEEILLPVTWPFRPVKGHPFGIDAAGRDVYSRVVHGMRIALTFGLALAFSGLLLGLVIGAIEGYFGGWTDICGQRFTEIWSAMPFLYIMIFVGSTIGRGFCILLVCYALFNWISVSRYMRAEFLRLRVRTFVEAAKCQGFSPARIIFKHILPNAVTPLVTLFPFLLMGAIGSLAALDFLGFGLPPMTPSLGELLSQAQQFRFAWWLVFFPGTALFIVMLLVVLIGEGLRDAFDPRERAILN
jgi:ABC-type microcin C transport system permease subunit YejE